MRAIKKYADGGKRKKKNKVNYDLPYSGPEFISNRGDHEHIKNKFAERGGSTKEGEYEMTRLANGSIRIRTKLSSSAS
tara:strand:- start:147 stop:380 length:234 start_codon:yes stop_codon:yes gene_type:complete